MWTGTILGFGGASERLVVNYTLLYDWGWIVAPIALSRSPTLHACWSGSLHDWNWLQTAKIVECGPHFLEITLVHLALGVNRRPVVIHTDLLKNSLALIRNMAFIVVVSFARFITTMVIYILLKAIFLQCWILLQHLRWISNVLYYSFDRLVVGRCSARSVVNNLIAARIKVGCIGRGSLSVEWPWIFNVILLLRPISISLGVVLIAILIALKLWRLVLAVTTMLTVNFLCLTWIDAFTCSMLWLAKGETIVIRVALSL